MPTWFEIQCLFGINGHRAEELHEKVLNDDDVYDEKLENLYYQLGIPTRFTNFFKKKNKL